MILAAVGSRRMKLQLLQPMAGRMDRPLFDAWASGAASTPATTPAAPVDNAASTIDNRFSRGRTGPPLAHLRNLVGRRGCRVSVGRPPSPEATDRQPSMKVPF